MDPAIIAVPVLLLISIGLNVLLSQKLQKEEVARRKIQEILRPWLTAKLGRSKARKLLKSLGNLLDIMPDDTLQSLLDVAPYVSPEELLGLVRDCVDMFAD